MNRQFDIVFEEFQRETNAPVPSEEAAIEELRQLHQELIDIDELRRLTLEMTQPELRTFTNGRSSPSP